MSRHFHKARVAMMLASLIEKKSSDAYHLTFIFQGRYLTPSPLAVINI